MRPKHGGRRMRTSVFGALFVLLAQAGEEPLSSVVSRAVEAHQSGRTVEAAELYDAALARDAELSPTVAAQLMPDGGGWHGWSKPCAV